MDNEKRFAILIDADNVASKYIKVIMNEISNEGVATYRRIYGDFTGSGQAKWKDVLLTYSISPVQQYSYTTGKNATDSALIIDAMDILYSGKVDGFCIVSSDSDFTRLAARLREAGMTVIGMGEQKTPRPFVNACNRFKYIDTLFKDEGKPAEGAKKQEKPQRAPKKNARRETKHEDGGTTTSLTPLSNIIRDITELYHQSMDDEGWMKASLIGDMLTKRYPEFDPRNYGCPTSRTVPFIESLGIFEIKRVTSPSNAQNPNGKDVYVRIKK